jgi:hypothetical protein
MLDDEHQHDPEKIYEDTEAHERTGLITDDEQNQHVDVDENGQIEESSRQNVWS